MNISNLSPLSPNLINLLTYEPVTYNNDRADSSGQANAGFADILTEALGTASEADTVDKVSSLELLMGQNDDLSGLMLDMQKAELSLNLALQIRNKIVDAYNEVMRMSV